MTESEEALFVEVGNFAISCGKGYERLDERSCLNLIEAIRGGRCWIRRNAGGELVRMAAIWLVQLEEMGLVKAGIRPAGDLGNGTILYVAECAGVDGLSGILRLIADVRRHYSGRITGFCWHKWNGGAWRWFYKGVTDGKVQDVSCADTAAAGNAGTL